MRKIAFVLVLGFFIFPNVTFAVVESCSENGYTIATINGVFTDERGAQENMLALQKKFGFSWGNQEIDYQYFLNPSHLAGFGDALKSFIQKVEDGVSSDDYDLIEMLKAASAKVTTQKVLLVAH